jgi:hypothetical protein
MSPVPLEIIVTHRYSDNYALEKQLHRRFARARQHGEWFLQRSTNELIAEFPEPKSGARKPPEGPYSQLHRHKPRKLIATPKTKSSPRQKQSGKQLLELILDVKRIGEYHITVEMDGDGSARIVE